MSKSNSRTVITLTGTVLAIEARTGSTRVFSATVTVRDQNPRARAEKAVRAQIKAQRPWMLLGPFTFTMSKGV